MPTKKRRRLKVGNLIALIAVCAIVLGGAVFAGWKFLGPKGDEKQTADVTPEPTATPTPEPTPDPNIKKFSLFVCGT